MLKKFLKDNFIVILGGIIANIFSFLVNIILLINNPYLANYYVFYNSISLILAFPSIVFFRLFSISGYVLLLKLKLVYLRNILKFNLVFIFSVALMVFLLFFYIKDIFLSISIFFLSFLVILNYVFRGISNYDLKFWPSTLSFNIETGGRFLFSYLFGINFDLGIYGIMLGCILSMLLALIPFKHILSNLINKINSDNIIGESNINYKNLIFDFLIISFCLEFLANFDIAYAIRQLSNFDDQTFYNFLQIMRKIIFHGTITIIPIILSFGVKTNNRPKLIFFYTLFVGGVISSFIILIVYFFRNLILQILLPDLNLSQFDSKYYIFFYLSAAFFSLSYLLVNWIITQRYNHIFIIIMGSIPIILILLLTLTSKILFTLILAIFYVNLLFFILLLIFSFYIIYKSHY